MSDDNDGQSSATSHRPEWMLAPPPSASIGDMLRNDPRAALKSRGFSQAGSQRVQKSGDGGGRGADEATLWTETPTQRAERLHDEEMGVRRRATAVDDASSSAPYAKDDAELAREDRIRAAIEQHKATRGPSLLEQHQEKRRTEMRKREADSDGSDSEKEERRRRREKRRKERRRHEEDGEADERRREYRHVRTTSVSPTGSDRSSTRRERHDRRKHRRDEQSDRRRRDEKEIRHGHHHRRRSRSRSPVRDERREEKDRRHEREKRRKKRDKEERGEKKGAPMMVWDREAALSVGGRLMDERKRLDVIKSSSSLNDRFGSGSSRYM